jgi:hypothetical protein
VGQAGAARSGAGEPAAPAAAAALAGHAAAHRCQQACWFQDGRYYDLITILDDATSEIYYAQLVEEGTRTLLPAVLQVIETQGVFCALSSDRAGHFFVIPKAGGEIDQRLSQSDGP